MTNEMYMQRALTLAGKGAGAVAPNPMVGAVIVKDGRIIGEGYHHRFGQAHAERDALAHCTQSPQGATIYVTLEPCCHHGKQPPCTDALIEAQIKKVVIGSNDPNPLVQGNGIRILREHGIEVVEHVLQAECDRLNEVFFHYIQTKRPFTILKYAMTLDGKIAAYTGESRWVTGEEARMHVHQMRHNYRAVAVGVETVLKDDPLLTCRLKGVSQNPLRIVCDTTLRTPLTAKIVQTAHTVPTVIATCCKEENKQEAYRAAGCQLFVLPEANGHVDLCALMQRLGEAGIDSVILEGGGTLNWSALQAGIVQKVQAHIAPKLFGGATAKTPVGGTGFPTPDEAIRLTNTSTTVLGEDLLIEGYPVFGTDEKGGKQACLQES